MLGGNALILGDNGLAGLVVEVETRNFTTQTLWHQLKLDTLLAQLKSVELEKFAQDLLRRQTNGL